MEHQQIQYLDYASTSDHNFHISLLKLPESVSLFTKLDQQILDILRHLNSLPSLTEKDAFYFVTTFILIAQRQMRNAFTFPTALKFKESEILVEFFDHDERTFYAVLLSFFDFCLKILAVFRKILATRFEAFTTSTESAYQNLTIEFEQIKEKYQSTIVVRQS